ncbi:MAG: hypothetical protein AAF821_04855 [Cyanobacteria bacterium P01_D01_bin.156]
MQDTPRPLIQHEPEPTVYKTSKPTRLYKRLEEALHTGSEVWFRMPGTRLVGIPIYLDSDYVEVVDVDVAEGYEDDELPDDPYQRTVWLIRLAEISAISYATDRWSKDRFERLLDQSDSDSTKSS